MPRYTDLMESIPEKQPVFVSDSGAGAVAVSATPQNPPGMIGINQITDGIERFLPMLERITGLSKREISLQVLKSALSGKGINGVLSGLMGIQPERPSRFEKIVKTLAVWVPVAFGLTGLFVILLIALYKLITVML